MTFPTALPAPMPEDDSTPPKQHHPYRRRPRDLARPRLPHRAVRLLRDGDTDGLYRDDFAVACSIIATAARVGFDLAYVLAILGDERNAGGTWFRRRVDKEGAGRAERAARRLFERSQAQSASVIADATDVRLAVDHLRRSLPPALWSGRTGATLHATFWAHTEVAMRSARLTYTASSRQIADLACVSRGVAQQRSRDLVRLGVLRVSQRARGVRGTTWTLCDKRAAGAPEGGTLSRSVTGSRTHPALRSGSGLDARIWTTLDADEPLTVREIAERFEMHPSTVRRKLANLERAGLARRADDTWQRLEPTVEALDRLADENGMAERTRKQHQRHRCERAEFRASYARAQAAKDAGHERKERER